MPGRWERYLERWASAGLLEASAVERIRAFEADQEKAQGLRWPVLLAVSLGGLLVGAGVLLFVAAHWDRLSPAARFLTVLLMVALFHVAGALTAARFSALAGALHAVGTVCCGAGIFLAGQIFHLEEHWPTGVLLWAIGAWAGWALRRDWPHAALAALLTPMWLSSEWFKATHEFSGSGKILAAGLLLLAISYLTALMPEKGTPWRKALAWLGGLTLMPAVIFLIHAGRFGFWSRAPLPETYFLFGWLAALGLPLGLAWLWRRRSAWMNLLAALWVVALGAASLPKAAGESLWRWGWRELGPYALCALGSLGLIAWGLQEERKERLNLGVAGFALTVLVFYFSNVMDKLGRAASLMGLGLLFLVGGYLLEKMRRRLVARLEKGNA